MKKLLYSFIFSVAYAVVSFAALASNPKHEEFAQNYLPESLAVFTQLSTELEETEALRESLREDLVLFDVSPAQNRADIALSYKIYALRLKLDNWNKFLQENYFNHLAYLKTSEQLAKEDSALAKETIAWKNSALKNILKKRYTHKKKSIDSAYSGTMIPIPGKDYSIGKYEVTQAQYQAVMGENPSYHKGDDLPVESVSWDDAMEFCKKLTQIERITGRLPAGMKYTLPTSEQWEYACRAGTTTAYNTGDGEAALDRAGWYFGNSAFKTHPVGQKEPNAWGIYDMHGNVWEWCLNLYNLYKYPSGIELSLGRVFRGGSYDYHAESCRSSSEAGNSRGIRYDYLGFRVALVSQQDQ